MMVRTRVVAALGAAVAVGVVAFASTAASQNARPAADDPNNANLTYWYWAENDAPGANGWLKKQVALYEKAHPKVKITVVTQSTDTLTSAFTTAAQTKSGPDIATQWATLPVLTPAWNGVLGRRSPTTCPRARSRTGSARPRTCRAASSGRCRSTCSASPSSGTRRCSRRRASIRTRARRPGREFLADAKKLKAAGITPFGMGNKDGYGGAWFFSLIGKQNLNSIDELKDAMIGKAKFSDPKYSGFYQALADLKKKGYLNSDVASISFDQGLQLFGQKKVAMSWVTDGNVAAAAKTLGGTKAWASGRSRSGARASSRRATTRRSRRRRSSRSGRSTRRRRRSS